MPWPQGQLQCRVRSALLRHGDLRDDDILVRHPNFGAPSLFPTREICIIVFVARTMFLGIFQFCRTSAVLT